MGKVFDIKKYIGGRAMSIFAAKNRPEDEARSVLQQYSLESTLPVDPLFIAEQVGVDVIEADFKYPDVSGLIKKNGDGTVIYIKHSDPALRKRFTVAHELGHLFLHLSDKAQGNFVDSEVLFRHGVVSDFTNAKKEIEANQFAASLLMPEELIEQEWGRCYSLTQMTSTFQVSLQAMEIRLRTLGLS